MPRLYKVDDDRKRVHSSRTSRTTKPHRISSSSSIPAAESAEASKPAKADDAAIDFDRFAYDAFDYGDDSGHDCGHDMVSNAKSLHSSSTGGSTQNHTSSLLLQPSNGLPRDGAMRTMAPAPSFSSTSSSADDAETTESSTINHKDQRISNSGSNGTKKNSGSGNRQQPSTMKPTVTSPRITHSDLAKNSKSSTAMSKRDSVNKKPMGNPISKPSKNGKKKNDENTDINLNQPRDSTVENETEEQQPNQKKQRRQQLEKRHVSFSGKTNGNKSIDNSSSNKMSMGWEEDFDASLRDTDEDSSEVEVPKSIPAKKLIAKTIRGAKRKACRKSAANRNNESHDDPRECPRIQILPQRIVAIDNRVIPTAIGDSMARSSFLRYIPQLVMAGLDKGILQALPRQAANVSDAIDAGFNSTIIASFGNGTKSLERHGESEGNTKLGASAYTSIVPRASYLFDCIDQLDGDGRATTNNEKIKWLTDFISPVSNSVGGHSTPNDDLHHGKKHCDWFAAGDSWSYFGDLVEAIEAKLFHSNIVSSSCARSITLFTTDANLFSDKSSSAHVRGVEQFLTRIRRSFSHSTRMLTITIMVVESTSIMQLMKSKCDNRACDSTWMGETSYEILPDRLQVIQCVTNIRRRIEEINQLQDPKSSRSVTTPLNLELEFMEGNEISFQFLLQTWMKESLAQTYAQPGRSVVGGGGHGRLSFDLPETLDGVMCSISLDLQYSTLPHRLDSAATKNLVDEMHQISMISSSSVEVVQTMPLSSVDSSLIYGVPMIAHPGFEKDVSRYDEMKMLVRQLWTYLSRNSVALVLRVHSKSDEDVNNVGLSTSRPDEHVYSGDQLFLLVCEEAVQRQQQILDNESKLDLSTALEVIPDKRRRGDLPCNGVLYRYATMSQLLHFGNEEKKLEATDHNVPGLSDQYLDFIERSLDSIVKTGVNPFLMGGNIIG